MAEDPIDPRYDPSFQRGFGGDRVARRMPASGAAEVDAATPVVAEDPAMPSQATAAEPRSAATTAAPAAAAPVADASSGLRRNPFVWVLVVIGLVLVLAGILLIRGVVAVESTGTPTADDLVALQTGEIAGPAVLILGGATLIGVLFLFAIERGRRSRA